MIKFDILFATYRAAIVPDCVVPYNDIYGETSLINEYVFYENNLLKLKMPIDRKVVRNIIESDKIVDASLIDALYKLANQCGKKSYVREPHKLSVDVSFSDGDYNDKNENLDGKNIKLVVMRRHFKNELQAITAMLVNTEHGGYNGRNSIFQPEISICSQKNTFTFERYDNNLNNLNDEEENP